MYNDIQMQNDKIESRVEELEPFINGLLKIANERGISNDDLNFVNELFKHGYMPELVGRNK